ncbi:unnamed protein product [Knipowitschia caucasica]
MNEDYFIEDLKSSEDEDDHSWTPKRFGFINTDDPPALLAYSITSGLGEQNSEPGPSCVVDPDGYEHEEGSSDEAVEGWMILDQDPEEEDSNIQLNLSFSISSDEDTNHEDINDTFPDPWAVSKRDKIPREVPSICRYFTPEQSLFCSTCKKTGHLAKSCQLQKKCIVCILCGIQGHLQKRCPSQPCSRCGSPSHGLRACDRLPVRNQHCQRCGLTGHLSDVCPDTWRQYHNMTTTKTSLIIRTQTFHTVKWKRRPAYCYNCSRRGHYGHECSLNRMRSWTFVTLPYVCHYDSTQTALQSSTRDKNEGMTNKTFPAEQQASLETFGSDISFQKRIQKSLANERKTWPERRRERRNVKKLRREAQARREGGLMGKMLHKTEDDILYLGQFEASNPWKYTCPSKKVEMTYSLKTKNVKRTQKERSKTKLSKNYDFPHLRERGMKDLLLSPKQRVRHRRR